MSLEGDISVLFPRCHFSEGFARVPCPYHKNGQERRPSMSIITKEGYNGLSVGYAKCFTCGWEGTFTQIANDYGMEYIPDTTVVASEEPVAPPKLNLQTAVYKKDTPYQYSPYLASRGISKEIQKKFRIYEKPSENKVYLPVFNREGQFLYANARATNTKMYFIPTGIRKELAYIEEVDFAKPVAICESQINALSLWTSGYCRAVATLGAANVNSLYLLKKNAVGPFLLMFDGDDAGRLAERKTKEYLGAHRCISFHFNEGEDVSDLWKACEFDTDKFFDELEIRRTQ